jgi:hypothetical protein
LGCSYLWNRGIAVGDGVLFHFSLPAWEGCWWLGARGTFRTFRFLLPVGGSSHSLCDGQAQRPRGPPSLFCVLPCGQAREFGPSCPMPSSRVDPLYSACNNLVREKMFSCKVGEVVKSARMRPFSGYLRSGMISTANRPFSDSNLCYDRTCFSYLVGR